MFSEKTCPSATFVHHKIPHDQTRDWTRAAAVGSGQLTAWAMAWPYALLVSDKIFLARMSTYYEVNLVKLILFILVLHTSKLNYRIIVNTIQFDWVCRYLLSLHVLVSWPSSEGMRSACSETTTTTTKIVIYTQKCLYKKLFTIILIKILLMSNIRILNPYGLCPCASIKTECYGII
jgi:hypothetical protein